MNNRPPDRSFLLTEQRNPNTDNLHELSITDCVQTIGNEDKEIISAIKKAQPAIVQFIESAENRFIGGGRLIYVGAGTSGRLGVLDASEAPPTFQVEPGRIIGIIAGGDSALRKSSEGKEDDRNGARDSLKDLNLNKEDIILGIAAGGTTPYVLGALEYGSLFSSLTGLLVCSPITKPEYVDHLILVETGPEVITGSTRMKAGTATKMALNTISTTLMIRSGRVYQNLMVDLRATNDKLRDRAARIVSTITGLSRNESFDLLDRAAGSVKTAVIMHVGNLSCGESEKLLNKIGCRLDMALELLRNGS